MNTLFKIIFLALAILLASPCVYAQKTDKQLKKELKEKADKVSRKDAKKYIKDGWEVMPGRLPLEKQLQEAKYSQLDVNDSGRQRYFVGSHESIGGSYSAAKQIADSRAHAELAQQVYNEINRLVKNQVSNDNFGNESIAYIDEFISTNKNVVSAQLQGIESVVEMYRKRKDGTYEMKVFVRVDAEKALRMSKDGYYNLLKQKSDELARELEAMLK